ncbi:hypothetical protein D9615_010246 [Tricholomella constricta]|uniref:Protein kinase domain-containing protein n=1 Tax=Tricholomella constricta TaxID=117010 RepID=A0A8H5LU43_9AGAR|nr:hypothetical protein D9615_010246 [Tricholomella constricta]
MPEADSTYHILPQTPGRTTYAQKCRAPVPGYMVCTARRQDIAINKGTRRPPAVGHARRSVSLTGIPRKLRVQPVTNRCERRRAAISENNCALLPGFDIYSSTAFARTWMADLSCMAVEAVNVDSKIEIEEELSDALGDQVKSDLRQLRRRYPALAYWAIFFISQEAEDLLKDLDRIVLCAGFDHQQCRTAGYRAPPTFSATILDAPTIPWGVPISSTPHPPSSTPEHHSDVPRSDPSRAKIYRPLRRSNRIGAKVENDGAKKARKRSDAARKIAQHQANDSSWPIVTIPGREAARPMADLFLLRAWAQSVERDSTFIVFNCGNFERIGFRHRASQTLYLTDLIDVVNCESPAYGHIQTGLYMSIVQDAIERMKQHQAKEELALPKTLKRQRSMATSLPSKRYKTRAAMVKEINEAQMERENFELVKKYAATRCLALIELRYGVYNSPAPASFVRSKTRRKTRYKSDEYLSIILTSEIASGATGVAHVAELKVLVAGRTLSSAAVVKLAFEPEQIQRLRHEFSIFQHLKSRGVVEGIPFIFGLFEDVETDALALVMTHVGTCLLTLWPNFRDMKLKLPEAARTSFLRVMSSIHQAGVLHMDIRPENLTISGNDQAAIIDFDQAELNHSEGAKRREMRHLTALLNGSYRPPGVLLSGQTTPEQKTPERKTPTRRKASLEPVAESDYENLDDKIEITGDAVDDHNSSGKNNS